MPPSYTLLAFNQLEPQLFNTWKRGRWKLMMCGKHPPLIHQSPWWEYQFQSPTCRVFWWPGSLMIAPSPFASLQCSHYTQTSLLKAWHRRLFLRRNDSKFGDIMHAPVLFHSHCHFEIRRSNWFKTYIYFSVPTRGKRTIIRYIPGEKLLPSD